MRERFISQDRAEQLIADIINRGGTTGEILTEIHHMEAADVLTPEEADAMAAMEHARHTPNVYERQILTNQVAIMGGISLCTRPGLFDESLLGNMATCAKITEALLDPGNGGQDNG